MKHAGIAASVLFAGLPGLILCASYALGQSSAREQSVKNETLQAVMKPDGSYELNLLITGWKLEGKLLGNPDGLMVTSGKDNIGDYREVDATTAERLAAIRIYDAKPVALFRDERKTKDSDNIDPFPTFRSLPGGLYRFSYQQRNFGYYQFGKLGPEGPWMLFDKQDNAMAISPADHFLVSSMDEMSDGSIDSRIIGGIQRFPLGFEHDTLIATGTGINHVFTLWGSALMALGGKQAPANNADVTLAKLGYWTDNRTAYYYTFDPKLGYTGTLLAVRDEFTRLGIPLGYMQLDSWFYPKGPENRWDSRGDQLEYGENEYRADKELFPEGLEAFQHALGIPMVTHARWVSPQSRYRQEFRMSGNVIIDRAFWKSTADYLRDAGVVTYEQDWLDENAHAMPNLSDPTSFLGEMAEAMGSAGINIQYCMPLPGDYMATTLYSNVETIRTSGDGFERGKWDTFLYDSRMAAALGVWPWTDAFPSKDLGSLIISTLSAGPVGVGDAIGQLDVTNLMAVVRKDGVIIKPDSPLLPIDNTYKRDALDERAPMVAMATTDFGGVQARYLFAYPRQSSTSQVTVPLQDLGISGPAFAYNWAAHQGQTVPANGHLTMDFADGWAFYVISPINHAGLALLGDMDKIASLGRARFASVEDNGVLTAKILFSRDETMQSVYGYAAHRPVIKALVGNIDPMGYNEQTHIFTIEVSPGNSHEAQIQVSMQ